MHYARKVAQFLYLKRANMDFVLKPQLRSNEDLFNDGTFHVVADGGGWEITRFL